MKGEIQTGRLDNVYEESDDSDSPPEPTLTRRAASYSDFYHVARAQLAKDGQLRRKKKPGKKDRTWEALALQAEKNLDSAFRVPDLHGNEIDHKLLEDSQQDYLYEPGCILVQKL